MKPSTQKKEPKKESKKEPKRTFNLDLSDVPPSDNIIFSKDYGMYNHEFWTHFYTPKDNITKTYQDAVSKLADLLPANFQLYEDEPTAFGVANVELKNEYKKPIKQIPLMSKLENGDYEDAKSKSDNNIASTIKFFVNNLPSFKKYKNVDDLSWVVNQHRLLMVEMLDYYAKQDKPPSTATIKSKVNGLNRIIRIAYNTKSYELYQKYQLLNVFLSKFFEDDEHNNELNEFEFKKFVSFGVILDKQKELETQFKLIKNKKSVVAYDLNQDLLFISLYSLIPPLRNEIKSLKFSNSVQRKGDWIVIRPDGEVLLDLNEEKKRHDGITFNLTEESPELANILKESYSLYPREAVFTTYHKYPDVSIQAKPQTLSDRITAIFSFTGKNVSVNSLRSSYVS